MWLNTPGSVNTCANCALNITGNMSMNMNAHKFYEHYTIPVPYQTQYV